MKKAFLTILLVSTFGWSAEIATNAPALVSVRMMPRNVVLGGTENPSQHFLVLALYADGIERDVTSQAGFDLSGTGKGQIDKAGKFTPQGLGQCVLTAEFQGRSVQSQIRIDDLGQHHPFSFAQDIGGIFTRRGCNSTMCHGSVKGKNGFKLSINAMFPRDDYKWIVEGGTYKVLSADTGPKNPRINLKEPEKSLILLKPTFTIPHGGGVRFAVGSRDYNTILNWVKNGAPYGADARSSSAIEKIEVFPREVVLEANGRQQLLVTGYLANGREEDLTEDVLYVSNDPSVADVDDTGTIEAKKTGETAVLIRAAGYMLSATVGVIQKPVANYPHVQSRNFIDDYVFAKLRRFNIVPSPISSDSEFLRRVCMDLTGTLPPPRRIAEFLADKDPDKRDQLIERLLNSPEYVDYWTFRFQDLMRATFETNNRNYMSHAYEDWVRFSIAANKPYDQMARERIAAQGYSAPSRDYYLIGELTAPEVIMPELVRVFMGRRIECAQCHNHPFEAWSQDQFWGLAAFFGGLTELADDNVVVDALGGNHNDKLPNMGVVNPRTKAKVVPAFLDGTQLESDHFSDPRMELARWMTSHPYFAEASVDRMWSYFFGRGIVDPPDDFRSTNPPTHPDLLQALAKDFQAHGYDLKHLIRTIVQSNTYQLSSIPNENNKDDVINYSHAQPRALEAAVLLDAISNVTGVQEKFEIDGFAAGGDEPPGTRATAVNPDICPSQFMDAFGRSMRKALPVGSPQPNLLEAMHMLAGTTYIDKISAPGGTLDRMIKQGATNEEILDHFYLAALTRSPTPEEKSKLLAFLARRPDNRPAELSRLVWAILCSREFAYNH